MSRLHELQNRKTELVNHINMIGVMATDAGRDLDEVENGQADELMAKLELLNKDIARQEKLDAELYGLGQSAGRIVAPSDPNNAAAAGSIMAPRITVNDAPGKMGYAHFGEFARDVCNACKPGGTISDRLVKVMNAPTTFVSEGVGQDGGYLVPPEFKTEIWEKVSGEESLLARTQRETTPGNTIVFPADETTPWGNSGGIRAYYESEAQQLQQSKMALQSRTISLNKLTVLVPVTSEMLEDAPSVDSYLRRRTPEVMDFTINQKMVAGSGVGEPLGILNAGSLITVAKDLNQPAATVSGTNIMNMWSRMYSKWRSRSVWLINQDIEPQLMQMYLAIKNVAGTDNVGGWPLYIPVSSGLSKGPYSMLMGRPVIETQAAMMLGSPGDIMLVDLKQYMTVVKSGAIRVDVSMHLFFDYDTQVFRFILRHTGQPLWKSAITPANDSVNTLSWAVALAQRS